MYYFSIFRINKISLSHQQSYLPFGLHHFLQTQPQPVIYRMSLRCNIESCVASQESAYSVAILKRHLWGHAKIVENMTLVCKHCKRSTYKSLNAAFKHSCKRTCKRCKTEVNALSTKKHECLSVETPIALTELSHHFIILPPAIISQWPLMTDILYELRQQYDVVYKKEDRPNNRRVLSGRPNVTSKGKKRKRRKPVEW